MRKEILMVLAMPVAMMAAQAQAPFEQDPLPDGVVSIEAEHFHDTTPGQGAALGYLWLAGDDPGVSGGSFVIAVPTTNNLLINSGYAGVSPSMVYTVNFNRVGTHYIVARGYGDSSADDSFHMGLDGQEIATSDRITGFNGGLFWSGTTMDGNSRAEFNVPSTGEHVVNIWMREDGMVLDKFIITSSSNFIPSGVGPPESPHGVAPPPQVDEQAAVFTGLWVSNGMVEGHFTPAPGIDRYDLLADGFLGSGMATDPVASVFGFTVQTDPGLYDQTFYAMSATTMGTNREQSAIVLNRLAYGPTPDELDRVYLGPSPIGANGYIQEQLAPELIADGVTNDPAVVALRDLLENGQAYLDDLRAWYALHAIGADRQLLEVLSQFFNNHFVTYYWKTRNYFRYDLGFSNDEAQKIAAELEYQELQRWRQVLLDPDGTFYDLLRISAESPAMIIYLDTVGNDKSEPNENYAREILELFCMGVDNGYDQSDIEAQAPVWTGWRVGLLHPDDADNPHAPLYVPPFLIPEQDTDWHYRKGTAEPDANWRELTFAENTNWFTGQAGIGFGDNDDNTVLSDMRYNYSSVYLRKQFVITNAADIAQLAFRLYVDDGCIVSMNGQEMARYNVDPGVTKNFDDTADASAEADWMDLTLTNTASVLVVGTNQLAMHVLNRSLSSSDLSADFQIRNGPRGVWSFVFDPDAHETTNKVIFAGKVVDGRFGPPWAGRSYELNLPERTGTQGVADGYDVVAHLANLPHTEEFISAKLCQIFVSEDFNVGNYYNITEISPEAQLIRDCMMAWETPAPGDGRQGNIREVLKVIFGSELFLSQAAAHQKVKTPFEYVISAIRALRTPLSGGGYSAGTDGYDLERPMDYMGMELFAGFTPDGWPEFGSEWIDTGTVTERLRYIQNLMMHGDDPLKDVDYGSSRDDNVSDPVALLQERLAAGQWSDAAAVTDFFIGLLYPGIGFANFDLERQECIDLLNTDATGAPSAFNLLPVSGAFGSAYNDRVRSVVGLLLAAPIFEEQ